MKKISNSVKKISASAWRMVKILIESARQSRRGKSPLPVARRNALTCTIRARESINLRKHLQSSEEQIATMFFRSARTPLVS